MELTRKGFLCNESHTQVWGEGSVTKCLQRREGAWGQSSHFHIKPRLGDEWFYPSTGEVETGEALALARSLRDSAPNYEVESLLGQILSPTKSGT